MEILFLSATLAMPAVAFGLHWKCLTKGHTKAKDQVAAPRIAQPQAACAKPAETAHEALHAAMASMSEQFAAIMARLERIESKVDLLMNKL